MLQPLKISENSKTRKKQSSDRLMIVVGVLQAIKKGNDENKILNYFYR